MGKLSKLKIAKLNAPLDLSRTEERKQGGRSFSYLKGHDIITTANEIFGFDGWSYEPIGKVETIPVGKQYISKATVKIVIYLDDGTELTRTDIGYGTPAIAKGSTDLTAQAVDTSEKAAVTDAMKRAFRSFGNQFGNSLYDKQDQSGFKTMKCPNCGGVMVYKVGYSKKEQKSYSGYVCNHYKKNNCSPIDFNYYNDEGDIDNGKEGN